ncbi:MAG TPA: polyprenyl synthetase family protein [Chloroflexaceae bacterium]|nr:polyprenyl synthetase family protein [Chloroflexaceae bacterium]
MTQFPLPPALAADMQQIEQIVHERTSSRAAVISVAGSRLLGDGGARERAGLVLMAAQTGTYRREQVAHAAAAVELIHAATRTHDDLVDEAERRRGAPRTGEWGHGVALMVGDYLFALASGEMALSPDPRVIGYYAHAVMRITEATLAPPAPLRPLEESRARHLERLSGAAAELYAAACKAGGACGGAPPEHIEALGRFGHDLGLALALGDEARDFAGPGGQAGGEPPGASLRAGVVTMPLIFAASHGDGAGLAAALDSDDTDQQAWALAEVRRHGLAPTRAEIARLAAQARVALAGVPPGAACVALARVADFAVARAA